MSRLRELFVEDPPSAEIAMALQALEATCCPHGRNPCYLCCGVMAHIRITRTIEVTDDEGKVWPRNLWALSGRWQVISKEDRLEWLERVEASIGQVRFETEQDGRGDIGAFERDVGQPGRPWHRRGN